MTMSRPGFSLIELIIAMMVLSVGILALASTMGHTTRVQGIALSRAEIASVAELHMDDLRSRATSKAPAARQSVLAIGGDLASDHSGYNTVVKAGARTQFRVRWQVQNGPVGFNDRLVTLRVMPLIPNRHSLAQLDFQTLIFVGE
jgi:prepilin-type N-terminal cleavage/methylation domain-containing protein